MGNLRLLQIMKYVKWIVCDGLDVQPNTATHIRCYI